MKSPLKLAAELKGLKTRKTLLQTEEKNLVTDVKEKNKSLKSIRNKIITIDKQIKSLMATKDSKIIISEHSMLRYIERVLGIDLAELETKILDETDIDTITRLGNCTLNKGDFKVIVKDKTVVTIVAED